MNTGDAPRSYVVYDTPRGPKVRVTHWVPGYTDWHKATQEEALDFAIARKEKDILSLQNDIQTLNNLKEKN